MDSVKSCGSSENENKIYVKISPNESQAECESEAVWS